jgi:HK97 gp10 family phage protein
LSVRLIDNLPKILPAVREKVAERLNVAAGEFVFEAQRSCPYGTVDRDYEDAPHLRDTIRQTVAATASRLEAEVRVGTLRTYWAKFVNYGTYKMAAQPFWTNTYLIIRSKFKGIMLD